MFKKKERPIDYEALELALTREIHKESFYEFYKEAFAQLHAGDEYDENWHAEYLCGVLQEEFDRVMVRKEPREKDIIINMPFRSSKSLITTVCYPVWCWTQNAKTKFIAVSYSKDLALEHAQLSKDLINSVWFQRLYGDRVKIRSSESGKAFYKTVEGGYRKSVGTGGQITGSGGDIIIVDDPQNPKLAASEKERLNTLAFYDNTLYSRLNSPDVGVRIIVMQRLHELDLTGHLIAGGDGLDTHRHINLPADIRLQKDKDRVSPQEVLEYYNNDLFWPTRFSPLVLKDYNRRLGEVQAAGQLQQRPAPAEGNMLKRDWFPIKKAQEVARDPNAHPIEFFIDTSFTEKQENDPNGILAGFKIGATLYIINAHEFYAEFPALTKFLVDYAKLHGYTGKSRIFVEPKASGLSLVQQMRSVTGLNIIAIEGDFIRDDKKTRLSAVSPIVQAGRVVLIEGAWNEKFLDQVTTFPNATHDEFVDTLVYMIQILIPTDEFFWGFL